MKNEHTQDAAMHGRMKGNATRMKMPQHDQLAPFEKQSGACAMKRHEHDGNMKPMKTGR